MATLFSVSCPAAQPAAEDERFNSVTARPRPSVFVLILFLLGCGLHGLAAGSESRSPSVLANTPGLEKPVTYSETKIPLGELMAKVASATGVSLTAARDVADEPVAVVVKEFPARELLEQLAELLDYRWSRRMRTRERGSEQRPTGKLPSTTPDTQQRVSSFEIYQDLASKKREEALRQARSAGVEQRFREEMAICRELSGKSQDEMRRLWDEAKRWDERLEKLTAEERQTLLNSPEGHRQSLRYAHARRLWSPIRRSLASFADRLQPEQWAALRTGQLVVFSSDPKRRKEALPPDVLRAFRTSRPTEAPPGQAISSQPDAEERARQREREEQQRWDQADHYDVIVQLLAFEPWWNPASIHFSATVQPFRGEKQLASADENTRFSLEVRHEEAILSTKDDPERRALLELDPVLSVKKPFQPDARPYVDPLFPGASRAFRLLPEVLPELARAYSVHFIADAYWITPTVSSTAGTRPLFEVLDNLTGIRFDWDRHESLIRIRDRRWFVDRPREVPLRHVRRWTALVDRLGALTLEEYASSATTLTDLQLEGLQALRRNGVFPPKMDILDRMENSSFVLRLYGRLSPAQRQALQAGRPVRIAQLSPDLRPLVLAQLYRANRYRYPWLDLEQWGSGHLTLSGTSDVRLREQRGESMTWRLESESATTRPVAVMRFPVTRLRFDVHYGGPTTVGAGVIVAADAAPLE